MRKQLKKWMVWRMIIGLCLLPLAETSVHAQRGMRRLPAPPRPVIHPAAKPKVRPPVLRPAIRPAGTRPLGAPAPAMILPEYPGAVIVPIPLPVALARPPRDWREASDQVSHSPLGSMASLLGSGLWKGWEFLKDHAPDVKGALSRVGDLVANGAALLPSIADITASVSQAAESVSRLASSALPSLSGLTASLSNAADTVSNTAASLTQPISGAAASIARVVTLIGDAFEKAKWFLVVLLALVTVLVIGRVIRLCLVAAQAIGRIIKCVTESSSALPNEKRCTMRGLLIVPALIAGVIAVGYFLKRERQPAQEAAMIAKEPGASWSGYWGEKTTSALLRLRQAGGSLSGDYAPTGDRATLCRFSGVVEGDAARFEVKIRGQLWHCTLERDGNAATLRGRKDMDALLDAYGKDGQMPNGAVIITPRNADMRREDAARLQRKREEIRRAAAPVLLGTFERIEVGR